MRQKKSFLKQSLNMISSTFNKTKEFIKKRKKVLIIILGSFILFLILLFILGIKIGFMTQTELNIRINPLHEVINAEVNKPVEVEFKIENNNFWMCNTQCEFTLYDPYTQKIIQQESEAVNSNILLKKTYVISSSEAERGQRLFYFEAKCRNIKSTLCQTEEKEYYSSSLITANYEYSKETKTEIEALLTDLNKFISGSEKSNSLAKDINLILNNIKGKINYSTDISNEEKIISENLQKNQMIQDFWQNNSYDSIKNIFNTDNTLEITKIFESLSMKKSLLLSNIETYNLLVDKMDFLNNLVDKEILNAEQFYRLFNFDDKVENITIVRLRLNNLKSNFYKTNIESIQTLLINAESIETYAVKILNQYNQDYVEYLTGLKLGEHKLIQERYNSLRLEANMSLDLNYEKDECDAVDLILNNYITTRIFANEKIIENLGVEFICENNCSEEILNNNSMKILSGLRNSIKLEDYNFEFNSTENKYTFNNTETIYDSNGLSFIDYIKMVKVYESEFSDLNFFLMNLCFLDNIRRISQTKMNKINNTFSFDNYLNLLAKLEYPEEKCCIFNSCQKCVDKSDKYPVILLHGHNFNKYNPIQSIVNSMTSIQRKLSVDAHFINGAEVDLADVNESEMWSKMNVPLAIRASYYYISYYDFEIYSVSTMSEESIENYAIRLREIINLVKQKTGAEKVDIIAHSMGGLVARYELFLFDDEDVNKLILIGTPNKGIIGKVEELCPTFGAKKECADMNINSIILKKLNSVRNIPENTNVFNIYGTGCDMDGEDGDGIVIAKNAHLDFATNIEIKGQCNDFLNLEMHNNLIRVNEYPEVYDAVIDILEN